MFLFLFKQRSARGKMLLVVSILAATLMLGGFGTNPLAKPSTAQAADGGGVGAWSTDGANGAKIVDEMGQTIRIRAINWYGLDDPRAKPHGIWIRGYKDTLQTIKALGYNTIRLPFANSNIQRTTADNTSLNAYDNPDLVDKSPLQIMDAIIAYSGQIGLRIILDRHQSAPLCDGNKVVPCTEPDKVGRWYDTNCDEACWIADWVMLANRYKNNPTVVGADLHNEPHVESNGAFSNTYLCWGCDGDNVEPAAKRDWRRAVERAGKAILTANSKWLIFVEGIDVILGEQPIEEFYWWGGNLKGAKNFPVRLEKIDKFGKNLPVNDKLVYSVHDYSIALYAQCWFNDGSFPAGTFPAGCPVQANYPNNLPAIWDKMWGYLCKTGDVNGNKHPIWIGEFGLKVVETDPLKPPFSPAMKNSELLWFNKLVEYMNTACGNDTQGNPIQINFSYWAINNFTDLGGLMGTQEWFKVVPERQKELNKLMPELKVVFTETPKVPPAPSTYPQPLAADSPGTLAFALKNVAPGQRINFSGPFRNPSAPPCVFPTAPPTCTPSPDLPAASPVSFTIAEELPAIPPGISVLNRPGNVSCDPTRPAITIVRSAAATGLNRLILRGNNVVEGLRFTGFSLINQKDNTDPSSTGLKNKLSCTVASKQ